MKDPKGGKQSRRMVKNTQSLTVPKVAAQHRKTTLPSTLILHKLSLMIRSKQARVVLIRIPLRPMPYWASKITSSTWYYSRYTTPTSALGSTSGCSHWAWPLSWWQSLMASKSRILPYSSFLRPFWTFWSGSTSLAASNLSAVISMLKTPRQGRYAGGTSRTPSSSLSVSQSSPSLSYQNPEL